MSNQLREHRAYVIGVDRQIELRLHLASAMRRQPDKEPSSLSMDALLSLGNAQPGSKDSSHIVAQLKREGRDLNWRFHFRTRRAGSDCPAAGKAVGLEFDLFCGQQPSPSCLILGQCVMRQSQ